MSQFEFLYNLGKHTYHARTDGMINPTGYLLSVHRYTPQFVNLALSLNQQYDEIVLADNGFFRKISALIDEFRPQSDQLLQQVEAVEEKLGRKVYRYDLPRTLINSYRKLTRQVRSAVYRLEDEADLAHVLSEQTRIQPDRFICFEDILQAALVGLNIEPEYVCELRRFYRYRNKRSARFHQQITEGQYGSFQGEPYAVASAVDYNSAYDAGREMAHGGITRIAIGAGAYMVDNHYANHYYIFRSRIDLGRNLPRRYLRSAYALKGLLDGYCSITKHYPQGVHYLGMGTPIMIMITALISHHVATVSYDATSPIKDAVEGVLYVTEPSYLKLKCRKLAAFYAQNPGEDWSCDCAYCSKYLSLYPMDYQAANDWFGQQQVDELKVNARDLKEGAPLAKALPLFSEPSGGKARQDISDWRQGHNHMMLERLMKSLNEVSQKEELEAYVIEKIQAYTDIALPHYAKAVEHALTFATG